ncbi:MAG: helicase-related protein [Proteobacteria bacterium]|nr:helicase-related protein [Pseudomonadota bacterium]MDA0851883.1 helicase-related protein [Pseudomonadota bacterium]MDA1294914.1 helicase-related protein [Pseudomonadota bacterium]
MTNKPDFIDNRDGNTLSTALRQLLGAGSQEATIVTDPTARVDEARIATAYFSPEGFSRIAPAITPIPSIKLLLGTEPIANNLRWQRKLDESEQRFLDRKLQENLKSQEDVIRSERDHIPFTRDASRSVKQLVASLRAGNLEVRRYEKTFLHAKAYIFSNKDKGESDKPEAVIAGSSNLTAAGLSLNLELNLGRYDSPTVTKAKTWFDRLWEEARPFDLAAFFEELFEPKTPFEIFLRVLWELYGDEVEKDQEIDRRLPLTTFQKHGVVRALRLIKETGGVIIADEVGLGKTFIAGEILNVYKERRQRALLLCPATLRDTAWKQFQSDFELYLETKSFEELARDEQLWDAARRPYANSKNLERVIDEYQLIIIDEAHNYRNPDSPSRADALRALLYGKRKDVLMLTATPVNNSLWDLYHLTRFYLKQDSFLANKGILSIKERFDQAMRTNPSNLSPDVLYPIVDATTVKRTRQFIKKHYPNDQVKINGVMQTIVFPEPRAITVRYELDSVMPGLFELIETYFDPGHPDCIQFARYKANTYLLVLDPDEERMANAVTGLLLSGLLKRFESSTGAFRVSIHRLIETHEKFLRALNNGFIVSTEFLKDSANADGEDFDDLLDASEEAFSAELYDADRIREDVESDLEKLKKIQDPLKKISPLTDSKLTELVKQLEIIASEAQAEAISREDATNKRKVLIFSFFSDTVGWLNERLRYEIDNNPNLSAYKNRCEIVVGNRSNDAGDKSDVAARFAPKTAGKPGDPDATDILICTDVLAEGVNLQQCRHIINYDMPWNPMRLVQRHGRIDRIGSEHSRVYLRTIFPTDRLESLLRLEERISRKIAMAANSVGVISPISVVTGSNRDFTETKEEIQKLLEEDGSIYERGGTEASTQSGEEYRQTLRVALEARRDEIIKMPWKAGSGMRKGDNRGIFFCAKVGDRTYLRFIHADENWQLKFGAIESEHQEEVIQVPLIDRELGRCLRIIECSAAEELVLSGKSEDAAYDLWITAREDIHRHWTHETDPANLQPKVRPLNKRVADFIRSTPPVDLKQEQISKALDIVESPWSRRDEGRLRRWFSTVESGEKKSKYLVNKILSSGLEPFIAPEPLPPISEDDIELLVWMLIEASDEHAD